MKKQEKSGIHDSTLEELKSALTEVSEKLDKLRVNQVSNQSRNIREAWSLRQKKAVILTVLKEKELGYEK